MLEENKKRNAAHRKVISSSLSETRHSNIPAYARSLDNRRPSFNKPRPPRPIYSIPCLNQEAAAKRRQKAKEASSVTSKPGALVREIKSHSISDQLNNNVKEENPEFKCDVDLIGTPQGEEMVKFHASHVLNANKSISDISGFKLDNVTAGESKDVELASDSSSNKENNLLHISKYPPNTEVSDIPVLSNRINEKLRQIAMERNRSICSKGTLVSIEQPSLYEKSTPATCDQILQMSALQINPLLKDSTSHFSQNNTIEERLSKHIGDLAGDVTDETLSRLSKKYLLSSPYPYHCRVGCKNDVDHKECKTAKAPSKIPVLVLEDNKHKVRTMACKTLLKRREEGSRMKYLMNGDLNKLTPDYERSSSDADSSEQEIPVIEQLIEKKTAKEGRMLTRPDIVPVDQKAKIYFLINHTQGTISHVIKSSQAIKSN